MKIRLVKEYSDLSRFLRLPYKIYRHDKVWVPPLRGEVRKEFNPKWNPLLDHTEYALFLLEEGNRVIGRIAAHIDRLAVDFWKEPIGLFGYYECLNDPAASKLLLDMAAGWLKDKGMKFLRGPWTFISQEWGMVIEGFHPSPVVMSPYNPPWYNDHLKAYGLEKIKDLLVFYISAPEGYRIPDRIMTLTDDVKKRYDIRIRQINMKQYAREVETVMELSNFSLTGNWGYSPVTQAEVEAVARDLKPIINPRGVLFAEDRNGRPIGFAITLPDVNSLLKGLNGRLFPYGWLKLLVGLPRLHTYRMFALGVVPEYHGKGVDALLYRATYESLYTPDGWMEINYVLEDNYPMLNAIKKLDAKLLRTYRVYQKEI
jgi:GNAT superfamily N-acetyltransferase